MGYSKAGVFLLAVLCVSASAGAQTVTAPDPTVPMSTMTAPENKLVSPSSDQRRRMDFVLSGMFVGIASDVASTAFALKGNGFNEANPIMRPFAVRGLLMLSVAKGLTGIAETKVLLKVHKKHPTAALVMAAVIGGMSFAAASYNLSLIKHPGS